MPGSKTDTLQGPFEESRCLAGPGGRWGPATIRRVNEDGTFKVEFDVLEMEIMPHWYGVTAAEVSFNDASRWAALFPQISPNGRSFTQPNFRGALASLGYQVALDKAQQLWDLCCQQLFNVSKEQATGLVLDESMSYQLSLLLGVSAKQAAQNLGLEKPQSYFKVYWNQTRMGGREPDELPRRVTLEDAFAALQLTVDRVDGSKAGFLQRFERKHAVHLPTTLKEFLHRAGVADAVVNCHPNNPSLIEFEHGQWNLRRGMRDQQLSGDYALSIMVPHQGSHEWAAVFDDKEDDARVYVRYDTENGEAWMLTAPGIGMFFWDLAQTGLTWHQDTLFNGGKPVKRSDIGLILDS
jgi:hypothetical protein